jgi:hypothetical protein
MARSQLPIVLQRPVVANRMSQHTDEERIWWLVFIRHRAAHSEVSMTLHDYLWIEPITLVTEIGTHNCQHWVPRPSAIDDKAKARSYGQGD